MYMHAADWASLSRFARGLASPEPSLLKMFIYLSMKAVQSYQYQELTKLYHLGIKGSFRYKRPFCEYINIADNTSLGPVVII